VTSNDAISDSRFEVRGLLGHGGCGVVHEAVDRKTSQLVALKVLLPGASDPAAIARLAREARVIRAINHPNVCKVIAHGHLDDGRPYIATELLRGETLREYLNAQRKLSAEETIEIGVQMLSGLDAAHSVGVVHRDIKPENVFVNWQNGRGPARIKILDFGLCRRSAHEVAESAIDERTLTHAGWIVGTPGYLAPEQVRGDRVIDASVDLFSVGLILFEALTGRRALEGHTPLELVTDLLAKPIPRLHTFRPDLPPILDRILSHATQRDVHGRYRSASQFQHDLLEARTSFRREERGAAPQHDGVDEWNAPTIRRSEFTKKGPSDSPPASDGVAPSGPAPVAGRNPRWLRHG
jgi:eukaryotic-like serine/threonine-protein kinase